MRGTKTIAFYDVTDEEFEIIKVRCHEIADEIGVNRESKKNKLKDITKRVDWLANYANGNKKLIDDCGMGNLIDEPSSALIASELSKLARVVKSL